MDGLKVNQEKFLSAPPQQFPMIPPNYPFGYPPPPHQHPYNSLPPQPPDQQRRQPPLPAIQKLQEENDALKKEIMEKSKRLSTLTETEVAQ